MNVIDLVNEYQDNHIAFFRKYGYHPNDSLSYNMDFNMDVSSRGLGKSYTTLTYCVNKYIKGKQPFVYIRRTEEEIKATKNELFNRINQNREFEHTVTVNGNKILYNGEQCGNLIPLSTAHKIKSSGLVCPSLMVFDEFLIEKGKGRYLPDEVNSLLGLRETVKRMDKCQLLMLGNNTTLTNIYYNFWNVYPKNGAQFIRNKEKRAMLHIIKSPEYNAVKTYLETGEIETSGLSDIEKYMFANETLDNNATFVERKSGNTQSWFTIIYNGMIIGVEFCESTGLVWFTFDTSINNRTYCFETYDHKPNMLLIKTNGKLQHFKQIAYAIETGLARYATIGIKYSILDLFNYIKT
jgi:hypothetical protein